MSRAPRTARTVVSCLVIAAGVSALSWPAAAPADGPPGTRPNVVVFLADDLGYGDLGCYGRTDLATPRLDALARQGVRLTQCYANGPECTPTRAALLTGRYQQWIGGLECAIGTGNVGRYDDAVRLQLTSDLGLPATTPTIVGALHDAGYRTGLVGKWHLGYEAKFAPGRHGFDASFYCVGGAMDYFHYLDNVAGYNLFRDGRPISGEGYFTDLITDEAVTFLDGQPEGQPFFLYVPYTAPHAPFQGPDDAAVDPLPLDSPLWDQGKAPPETYIAMVERMDASIGTILDALDRRGLTEDTLVIFASDNGGTKSSRNAPLSGTKGSTYEGGIRVPTILRWPGHLPAGVTSDQVAITFDLTATIAAAAGVTVPGAEGIDLIGPLTSGNPPVARTLFWRKPRGEQTWRGVRRGDLKYVARQDGETETVALFDLSTDVAEKHDLSERRPDDVAQLRRLFDEWETTTRRDRRGQPGWTGDGTAAGRD